MPTGREGAQKVLPEFTETPSDNRFIVTRTRVVCNLDLAFTSISGLRPSVR